MGVPRVTDRTKVTVNARRALTEPVHIHFSDYDRPGVLEFGNGNSIFSGHAVFEMLKSSCCLDPDRVVKVFDTHGYAMQRTSPFTCLYFAFRNPGVLPRLVSQYGYECVELWVDLFN